MAGSTGWTITLHGTGTITDGVSTELVDALKNAGATLRAGTWTDDQGQSHDIDVKAGTLKADAKPVRGDVVPEDNAPGKNAGKGK